MNASSLKWKARTLINLLKANQFWKRLFTDWEIKKDIIISENRTNEFEFSFFNKNPKRFLINSNELNQILRFLID